MKKILLLIFLATALLLPLNTQALEVLTGGQVSVDSPVNDDVYATGGMIVINSPVNGLVAFGGTIEVNSDISGDVFVAGGMVKIKSNVNGKIVAFGGNVELSGNAENLISIGGNINILPGAVISRDAVVSGGSVQNSGTISGKLTVRAGSFQNAGTVGTLDYDQSGGIPAISLFVHILSTLIFLGFLVLGLVAVWLFPKQFSMVEQEVRRSPVRTTIIGFIFIIVSLIVITLVAVSFIGLPIAAIMGMLFVIALVMSTIFVSSSLGRVILKALKSRTKNEYLIFILGFIVLNILFWIPFVGGIILCIAVSLGFGAIYYSTRRNWKKIRGR